MVASRYQVGRVKESNDEGITYTALDLTTKKLVELREYFPRSLAVRNEDGSVAPVSGQEADFDRYLDEFIALAKNVSRLREVTVVHSVLDLFEENYTAYAVYEDVPSVSLRRWAGDHGGTLPWNTANRMFQPVLSALGLMNSLGISHLGISPDTLRVTQDNSLLITSFSIQAARREGTSLEAELAPGCAAWSSTAQRPPVGKSAMYTDLPLHFSLR